VVRVQAGNSQTEVCATKKKNVAGIHFTTKSGPDNRTQSLVDPEDYALMIAGHEDRNQSVAQEQSLASPDLFG